MSTDRIAHHLTAALILLVTLSGCASWFSPRTQANSSSVVSYLYPDASATPDAADPSRSVTWLKPPLKVGIAFVPNVQRTTDLAETERMKVLARVKAAFEQTPYISSIEVIPTHYLRARGGFGNLEQAARMFQVDVVALVSYDQIQFNDSSVLSALYWTIVGAYIVHGDRYDVQTLLDISVFDVKSRRLLLRAPGQSQVKGSASMASFSGDTRNARIEGFAKATDEAIPALQKELELFKERIKNDPQVKVEVRPGQRGGSSVDGVLALAALLSAWWVTRRKAPAA